MAAWLAKKGPISIAINAFGMQVRLQPHCPCSISCRLLSLFLELASSCLLSPTSSTVMGSPTHCGPSAALGSLTMLCYSWAMATVSSTDPLCPSTPSHRQRSGHTAFQDLKGVKSGESLGTLSLPLPLAVGQAGSSTRFVTGILRQWEAELYG